MRAKSIILLIIALACGTVASVGVSQVILDQRGNVNEVPMADVVVVAREIEANQKIPLDAIKIEKWPQTRLPEGVVTKIQDIDGHFTRQKLFPGEPIIAAKIADSTNKGRSVPMGYRVFDLPVDERKGAAGYIQPGDFVDVHGLFKIDNVSESRVVVSNVQIFGVNGSSVRDEENKGGVRATTFQLLVKEGQLEALSLAAASGDLRCSLRPLGEKSTEEDTGEEFVKWLRSKEPQKEKSNPAGPTGYDKTAAQPQITLPPPVQEKKKELLIITPNGVTKYQWSGEKEVPTKVEEKPEVGAAQPYNAAAGYPYAGSSLFSGFGGYTPTYPGAGNGNVGPGSKDKDAEADSKDEPPTKKSPEPKRKN